jgi:hypothetical protein
MATLLPSTRWTVVLPRVPVWSSRPGTLRLSVTAATPGNCASASRRASARGWSRAMGRSITSSGEDRSRRSCGRKLRLPQHRQRHAAHADGGAELHRRQHAPQPRAAGSFAAALGQRGAHVDAARQPARI